MNTLSKRKEVSSCCAARVKPNMLDGGWFCDKCLAPCESKTEAAKGRKVMGEMEAFHKVWGRCKGKSEVSGLDLLPFGHPMWHWQFSHLLPKGSYPESQTDPNNIVACTVEEHTNEWPFAKECTDAELREMGYDYWIPKVTVFRALRLKYNKRLNAELSGGVPDEADSVSESDTND
jgi:hypothetical protein